MDGLTPTTELLFEPISKLECISPYTLVGGTALSIQLNTRLSDDLDFMSWKTSQNEKLEVDWVTIQKELSSIGEVEKVDILDFDHIEFVVSGVKISFYANPNYSPLKERIHILNNLFIADKTAIGGMKMEVLLRRSKFRDYYDIYSLLQAGMDINEMIEIALKYSGHRLKSKNLLAMLTKSDRFNPNTQFKTLNPKYQVTPKDIENLIISKLLPTSSIP